MPVWDRGYMFGDAVYEVCRLYGGRPWLWRAHLDRLGRSIRSLRFPAVDLDALAGRARRTIEASGVLEGTIYLQLSRGVAPRRHAFPRPAVPPTELIIVQPYDDGPVAALRRQGVSVISQPDIRWGRCDIKSTNLLANVLANEAAHECGAYEAVLVDEAGLVTEATHSSVLWVRGGRLGGTPEGNEILPGTTRHHIMELARDEGIAFESGRISLADLADADEVFLAGTTIEILPVVRLDGRPIAGGAPGPVTRRLQDAFARAVARFRAGGE